MDKDKAYTIISEQRKQLIHLFCAITGGPVEQITDMNQLAARIAKIDYALLDVEEWLANG